jgi:hypothetical protein
VTNPEPVFSTSSIESGFGWLIHSTLAGPVGRGQSQATLFVKFWHQNSQIATTPSVLCFRGIKTEHRFTTGNVCALPTM